MMRAVDPTLDFRLVTTRGAAHDVAMLEDGDLDLALVSGEVAQEVLGGVGQRRSSPKVVTAIHAMPGMFTVRADRRASRATQGRGTPVDHHGRSFGETVQIERLEIPTVGTWT